MSSSPVPHNKSVVAGSDMATSLRTPVLGLGCSRLTANHSVKAALRTLDTAFDLGIYYFDTARLYGYGRAESILGSFIRNKRDKIIVTTKAGLNPREFPQFVGLGFLNMTRKSLRAFRTWIKPVNRMQGIQIRQKFVTPGDLRLSLEKSLKELQTDYVDFFLLHEFSINEANAPEILRFCDDVIREGKVRATGLGSESCREVAVESNLSKVYTLIQFEYDILQGRRQTSPGTLIRSVHGVFRQTQLFSGLMRDQSFAKPITEIVGRDLSDTASLHHVLLGSTRLNNADGIVLFSSSKTHRIKETIGAWKNPIINQEQLDQMTDLWRQQLKGYKYL